MFLKAIILVAVATAVSADDKNGGKSEVVAVAKANKEKIEDGFKINLDGGDSKRECANARWEVKAGGKWVLVSNKMYAKYVVGDKPKTYKFRLTIWDPVTKSRTCSDCVEVSIGGAGKDNTEDPDKCEVKGCGYKKGNKLFADADILKVTETKNGYAIRLSAEDSKNCDDYVWEYKSKDGYIAIATNEKTTYEVDKEGKHKFRLICIDDKTSEIDIDSTWANIFECKDPKYPCPDDNKGDGPDPCKNGKKHCDPCKGVDCKAKAEIGDVKEKADGWVIHLTAANSVNCKTYSWERLRDKFDNEYIGEGETQTYKVDKKGSYKFRVTCVNSKCNDSDKDTVESDCVVKY